VKSPLCSLALALLTLSSTEAAVLWRDPGPVESLDLAGGPGGADKAPKPPFTFVEEVSSGTAPKIVVKDSAGVEWVVKFGNEAKPETFANRITWAAGYFAMPTHYVGEGKIEGAKGLGRAGSFVSNGMFRDARFQLKDDAVFASKERWKLDDPQLKDSRELAGYKVLIMLLANWDLTPENLSIVNRGGQQVYAVTDWGATMGRPTDLTAHTKWDCKRYSVDTKNLVEGLDNGYVVFNFSGKQGAEVRKNIRQQDVAWIMERLGKLSDAQIDAALKASGATADEAACFGPAFRSRLAQLMNVATGSPDPHISTTTTRKETKITIKQR
jgi:hypothetical protein